MSKIRITTLKTLAKKAKQTGRHAQGHVRTTLQDILSQFKAAGFPDALVEEFSQRNANRKWAQDIVVTGFKLGVPQIEHCALVAL